MKDTYQQSLALHQHSAAMKTDTVKKEILELQAYIMQTGVSPSCRCDRGAGHKLASYLASRFTTSITILPRGSPSASTSRKTTGFFSGSEEKSLAAAMPGGLYFRRVFI